MAECMMPARPSKEKSAWDRDASLASLTGRSPTVDRLYGDAKNPPRNAKALRAREKIAVSAASPIAPVPRPQPTPPLSRLTYRLISPACHAVLTPTPHQSYVPPPSCKPEGYELMTSRPEMFNSSRGRETARYTSRGPETARVRDMGAEAGVSKKKADFGSGHPMWSPYYRPTGKTSDGKPIIPIDYFKQSSREWGAFKTDPNLVELGPRMLEANARLANNIKEQISFNPYPHHLSLTPRNSAGEPLVEKKVIDREDAKKMLLKMLASERPMLDRDEEFTAKFTRHMYVPATPPSTRWQFHSLSFCAPSLARSLAGTPRSTRR